MSGPNYRVHDPEVTGIITATTVVTDAGTVGLYCRAG